MGKLDFSIWKYVDLVKMISMLRNDSIYFSRVDSFEDPFDGLHGKRRYYNISKRAKKERENVKSKFGRELSEIYSEFDVHGKSAEDFKKGFEASEEVIKEIDEYLDTYLVSCWHINEKESLAMWDLYVGKNQAGVALKVNAKKLVSNVKKSILSDNLSLRFEFNMADKIVYKDLSDEILKNLPLEEIQLLKRKSFEHEKEFRIIIKKKKRKNSSLNLRNIKLFDILEEIVISPRCSFWQEKEIRALISQFGYNTKVSKSKIFDSF